MMIDSVSNGVASNAEITDIEVAGKTGTAENGEGIRPLFGSPVLLQQLTQDL
jgi:cell division protein FtsI/penicillin-binding protein 2